MTAEAYDDRYRQWIRAREWPLHGPGYDAIGIILGKLPVLTAESGGAPKYRFTVTNSEARKVLAAIEQDRARGVYCVKERTPRPQVRDARKPKGDRFVLAAPFLKWATQRGYPVPDWFASAFRDYWQFVPYEIAKQILIKTHNAKRREIAMWVSLGPSEGGIAAYHDVRELCEPERYFLQTNPPSRNYLPLLEFAYFVETEVREFKPKKRFVTGKYFLSELRKKGKKGKVDAIECVRKYSRQARGWDGPSLLQDGHPTYGGTQATFGDESAEYPPIEEALFDKAECDEILVNEFGLLSPDTADAAKRSRPVSLNALIAEFKVKNPAQPNEDWWRATTRGAKDRPMLLRCRASPGRGKSPSFWYPDEVADWLVKQSHIGASAAAKILRDKKFGDCPHCKAMADALESTSSSQA